MPPIPFQYLSRHSREEVTHLFARHVSSGKVRFFEAAGIDFALGRREGPYLWDLAGEKRLIDCHCNGGVFNLGHRNPEIISALVQSLQELENGIPDEDDDQRPRFLLTHLAAMHRAIEEGVPVKGYFHWSLVDNFEWAEGWSLRFGLIALDIETQERTVRRSGQLYKEICQAGAITEDMVKRYAPEVLDRVFPVAR